MSKISEWKIQATKLLKNYTPVEVCDMLYPKSGYKNKHTLLSKLFVYNKVLRANGYEESVSTIKAFNTLGEYKEIRSNDGSVSITDVVDRRLSDEELYKRYGRDSKDWRISMVWFKDRQSGFLLSCCFIPIAPTVNNKVELKDNFIKKLKHISPLKKSSLLSQKQDKKLPKCLVLIPKQDSHFNKFSVDGDNSIAQRFVEFNINLYSQLNKVSKINCIDEITYIVGSDEFNSEWNSQTTKGTPQQNILTYTESFEKITEFNISVILFLLTFTPKVNIVLLNGNHDHNTGWHLANTLKQVFKLYKDSVIVDDSQINTKLLSWSNNLILINHGDEMKPKELAAKFPVIANEQWSKHSNYFVITGDKHHEIAHDFNGIMTYQVPQLSKAKSAWDDKKGHITSKSEMVNFVFESDGLSAILRNKM